MCFCHLWCEPFPLSIREVSVVGSWEERWFSSDVHVGGLGRDVVSQVVHGEHCRWPFKVQELSGLEVFPS